MIRRRQFITLLGGAAAWPLAARAQQKGPMRRVGVLMSTAEDSSEGQARLAAFAAGLQQLGWSEGYNVRIETRWSAGNAEQIRQYAAELVNLEPEVILASTTVIAAAVQQLSATVPIVFAMALDPVNNGLVESLAHPGGNTTGFMQFEYSLSGKWLELLKQIAPGLTRAIVLRDVSTAAGIGQFAVIQAVAPLLGVDVIPVNVRDAVVIERAVTALAGSGNGGVIVTGGQATAQRQLIIKLAAQHRLPAVYPYRFYVIGGGLISYGPDLLDQHRRAASYVDRVLKGEKPSDLPVQAPTKYETVLNLKTAKALGLEVPATVFARADEVIE